MYNTNAMKKRKLLAKRPKAKNGQKRQVTIKHILLPEELVAELQLYKQAYSDVLNQKVSWEQMFHRWMESIGRFDPDVKLIVEAMKMPVTITEQTEEPVVSEHVEQPSLKKTFPVDPTEGDVWEMKYFFEKDGEQIPAEWAKSEKASFSAKINNRYIGVREMNKNGWTLRNDAGIDITEEQAMEIARKRRKHLEDIEEQRLREQARRYSEQLEEEVPAFDYKYKLEKDGEIKEVFSYEMDEYFDAGWTMHIPNLKSSEEEK